MEWVKYMRKQINIEQECLNSTILAECNVLDEGIHILLVSKDYGHVGAVSHIEPEGKLQTLQFPSHEDAVISDEWAKKIGEQQNCPITVCCGIHYKKISKEEIAQVLLCTRKMLIDLLNVLKKL